MSRKLNNREHPVAIVTEENSSPGLSGEKYHHINVRFWIGNSDDRRYYNGLDTCFHELVLSDQIDSTQTFEDKPVATYGWQAYYSQPFRVHKGKAQEMYVTLDRIDRALRDETEENGAPATFGEWVCTVLKALKCWSYILNPTVPNGSLSGLYDKVLEIDIVQITSAIDDLNARWISENCAAKK